MASHSKVLNLSRRCSLDKSQALKRIKAGVAAWVEENVSFRELAMAEILSLRVEQQIEAEYKHTPPSQRADYLPILEPDGHTWEPPAAERYQQRDRWALVAQARQFCNQATG